MVAERVHRGRSADGTEIAGRVHGQGPPVVLLHGRLEDGDLCWRALLPHLVERFTCFCPSTRGRGMSGDNTDHSPARLGEDVVAFVESIDEPVRVFGESRGAVLALGVASQSTAVTAACVYQPTVADVMGEEDLARVGEMASAVGAALEHGRPTQGLRRILEVLGNQDELVAVSGSDYLDAASQYLPLVIQEFQQAAESTGPAPTDASELARIVVLVLVLYGSQTALGGWITRSARHVAEHVATAQLREVDGIGHFGPVVGEPAIADEITRFFTARPEPA
jgi:pimeloyl-ACP methyl ester carboxylesterase